MPNSSFFKRAPRTRYRFKTPEELSPGDVTVTTLDHSRARLPSPESPLSGEDIELLKTGETDGIVTRDREEHFILDASEDFSLPDPLSGIEQFLKDDQLTGLAEALSLALDLALYHQKNVLHSKLVEVFRKLQAMLKIRKKTFNFADDGNKDREQYVNHLYTSLAGEETPNFQAQFHRINRKYVRFHKLKRSLYDELAKTISESFGTIQQLTEGIELGSNSSSHLVTKQYQQFLLEELGQQRIDLSPLNDFSPDRLNDCLILPVFDDDDEQLRQIISLIKQLIDNILFRGVFLEQQYERLLESLTELTNENEEIFTKLTFPKKDSDYLLSHIVNVWLLSVFTGRDLDLSDSKINSLGKAALFFDLGMLRVPPSVWREADRPSDEGIDRIKRHPLLTVEWLEQSYYQFDEDTLTVIKRHHERLDGSGYPLKIDREDLSLLQDILIVVDVYDAMSTTRPHRAAISPDKIITYLKNRLNKFDERVVRSLEENLGAYPPGTVVQLNTNEIGVTVAGGSNPSTPQVKIMIDHTGTVYDDPEVVDLNEETDKRIIDTIGNRNTPTAILDLMGQ